MNLPGCIAMNLPGCIARVHVRQDGISLYSILADVPAINLILDLWLLIIMIGVCIFADVFVIDKPLKRVCVCSGDPIWILRADDGF